MDLFVTAVAIDCTGNSTMALELQNFLLDQGLVKTYPGNAFTEEAPVLVTQYRSVEGTFGFAPCVICYEAANATLFKAIACMTKTLYGIPNEYWLCIKDIDIYVKGTVYKADYPVNELDGSNLKAFPSLFIPVSEVFSYFQKASMEDLVSALG